MTLNEYMTVQVTMSLNLGNDELRLPIEIFKAIMREN